MIRPQHNDSFNGYYSTLQTLPENLKKMSSIKKKHKHEIICHKPSSLQQTIIANTQNKEKKK